MDLIERYLAAIGRQLPAKQSADIQAELRDVLLSRVEEQESRLGRPLQKPELEALLVDFGHPLAVAGRYRKVQQLIGPEVFPYWWATIKVMLSVLAGVYLVLVVLGVLTHATQSQFDAKVPSILVVVIYLFGLITLVFTAFERFGKTAFLREWKPSRLPPAGLKTRSRFEIAVEVGFDVVFILWWIGVIHFRNYLPAWPGGLSIELAPVWAAWRWPIVAYYVVEIAANLLAIARPAWMTTNALVLSVRYLAGVGILAGLLQAGRWLVLASPTMPSHALAEAQTNFDTGMRVGIGLTILGMAARVGLELWRLWRARQAMAEPAAVRA
jgi:hypothetical protein